LKKKVEGGFLGYYEANEKSIYNAAYRAISDNLGKAAKYQKDQDAVVLGFFIGITMRNMRGKASRSSVVGSIKEILESNFVVIQN